MALRYCLEAKSNISRAKLAARFRAQAISYTFAIWRTVRRIAGDLSRARAKASHVKCGVDRRFINKILMMGQTLLSARQSIGVIMSRFRDYDAINFGSDGTDHAICL